MLYEVITGIRRLGEGPMALDESVQDREAGVPFLKDIPLLGWLARSTLHERVQRTLVIAVRAGISYNFV